MVMEIRNDDGDGDGDGDRDDEGDGDGGRRLPKLKMTSQCLGKVSMAFSKLMCG